LDELVLGDLAVVVRIVAHDAVDLALLELGEGDLLVPAGRAGGGLVARTLAAGLRAGREQRQGCEADCNGRPHVSHNSVHPIPIQRSTPRLEPAEFSTATKARRAWARARSSFLRNAGKSRLAPARASSWRNPL